MKPTQKTSNSSKSSMSIQKKTNTIDDEFWYTYECAILLNGFLCREQSEFLLHFNVLLKFAVDCLEINFMLFPKDLRFFYLDNMYLSLCDFLINMYCPVFREITSAIFCSQTFNAQSSN